MPLLGDKIFVRRPHPDVLTTNPDSKFIYFPLTDELFERHEDYFERYIQCFSDVWTCQYTKSSNLTYEAAIKSEEDFLKTHQKLPKCFHLPILLLVNYLKPEKNLRKLASTINFVLSLFYVKDETVGFRKFAQTSQNTGQRFIIRSQKVENGLFDSFEVANEIKNEQKIYTDDNDSSFDNNGSLDFILDNQSLNEYRFSIVYELVSSTGLIQTATMKMIRTKDRHSNYFNIECIMIFIKDFITYNNEESNENYIFLKPYIINDYNLNDINVFCQTFPFPSPLILQKIAELCPQHFESSRLYDLPNNSPKKFNRNHISSENSTLDKYITPDIDDQNKDKNNNKSSSNVKSDEHEKIQKQLEAEKKKKALQEAKILEARRREELILKEKRLKEEYLKKLNIARDDFLTEDLKPFEKTITHTNVDGHIITEKRSLTSDLPHWKSTRLTETQFLSVLELSEFINLFVPILDDMLTQYFPTGIDLSLIESCIISKSPDSSYGEILQMFLSTILNLQKFDLSNIQIDCNYDIIQEFDELDPFTNVCAKALDYKKKSHQIYGIDINNLVLDNCTISEVLRLHILAGGSSNFNCSRSFLARQKGCIQFRDDPSIQFKLDHPRVTDFLSKNLVYMLETDEKLDILLMLMHQIMITTTFRDYILSCNNIYTETRNKIRHVTSCQTNIVRIESSQMISSQNTSKQQKICETREDDLLEESNNKNEQSKVFAARDDAFSRQISTRTNKMDPYDIYEKLNADPVNEFCHSKCDYLLKCFRDEKNTLLANCLQNLSALRCIYLGMDRYFRHYYISNFYNAILIINTMNNQKTLNQVLHYYSSAFNDDHDEDLLNRLKNNFGIDIKESFQITPKQMNLSSIISQNIKDVFDLKLPAFSMIDNNDDFNIHFNKLSLHGQREKVLRNSMLIHRDLINVMLDLPMIKREQAESFICSNDIAKNPSNGIDFDKTKQETQSNAITKQIDNNIQIKSTDSQSSLVDPMSFGQGLVVYDILVAFVDLCEKLHSGHVLFLNRSINILSLILCFPQNIMLSLFDSNNFLREHISMDRSALIQTWVQHNSSKEFTFETLLFDLKSKLIDITETIDPDFLIEPLGVSVGNKKKKNSRKLINSEKIIIGSTKVTQYSSFFPNFLQSLMRCTSFAQLSLYFSIIENSVAWNRSAINKSCYQCRRKIFQPTTTSNLHHHSTSKDESISLSSKPSNNSDDLSKMMICSLCERTFHLGCVKNPCGPLATSEWFCSLCRSQVVMRQSPSKQKSMQNTKNINNNNNNQDNNNDDDDNNKHHDYMDDDDDEYDDLKNSNLYTEEFDDNNYNFNQSSKYNNIIDQYIPERSSKYRKAKDSSGPLFINEYNMNKSSKTSNSSAMVAISKVLDALVRSNEYSIIHNSLKKQQKTLMLTFEEIIERFNNCQYDRPSQIAEDTMFAIDQFHEVFARNSNEAISVISFENHFKDLMNSYDLSYFLD